MAQIVSKQDQNFIQNLSEQQGLALRSHQDINELSFSFKELDYENLKFNSLLPNFFNNFEIFVRNIVHDASVPLKEKFRYVAYLASVMAFSSRNDFEILSSVKSCFNTVLYLRFSEKMVVSSLKNGQSETNFDPNAIPIFISNENDLIKSILFLMTA